MSVSLNQMASMGDRITFKSNGSTATGYLARPAGPRPGVIVIQEWSAGKDGFMTPARVTDLDGQLTLFGKRHEFHTYPGADRAFFNDDRPNVYDPAAAADAWDWTLTFFRRELKE